MLIVKQNPTGIDVAIQKVQSFLHSKLITKWGTDQYNAYGRCYRNRKEGGYIAEWYEGNGEYKEVYYDDRIAVSSFFGTSNQIEMGIKNKVNIHLVFFVNLSRAKPLILHRADEEARNDVLNLLGNGLHGMVVTSVDMWLENCLREYPETIRSLRQDNRFDMHPVHCFRINFSSLYNTTDC
jgi:hypothetical protein